MRKKTPCMLHSRFETFYNILVLCCLDQVLFVVFKYSNKPVTQAVCLHCFDLGGCMQHILSRDPSSA